MILEEVERLVGARLRVGVAALVACGEEHVLVWTGLRREHLLVLIFFLLRRPLEVVATADGR